ncbi:MAG: hypothetical protein ACLQBY_14060 [Solirubrobacteraceae bacterium]
MSASGDSERPPSAAPGPQGPVSSEGQGVLSRLPRTRPQRSSPRRAAARAATAAAEAATAAPARSNGRPPAHARKTAKATPKRPAKRAAKPAVTVEPVPRQGFECEGERTSGSVHPPGGAELVASAAEIVGELAKAGLSTGERLLKDVLSRLPLS